MKKPYPQLAKSGVWFFFNGWKRLVDAIDSKWNHQKVLLRAVRSAARLDHWEGLIEQEQEQE